MWPRWRSFPEGGLRDSKPGLDPVSLSLLADQNVASASCLTCMHTAVLSALMIMDEVSETLSKSSIKCFPLYGLPWPWCCLFMAIEL